ncbi:MAG: helix-turn-helix domain-containing protein [Candidatus Puniceispirillaceae bacterium]
MTPFGAKIRYWRSHKNLTLQEQAEELGVTSAYLSALETGTRGRPSTALVDQICVWLELIWDDAEELKRLASLSHPKPTINTRRSHADATYLANFLAQNIVRLTPADCQLVTELIGKCLCLNDDTVM